MTSESPKKISHSHRHHYEIYFFTDKCKEYKEDQRLILILHQILVSIFVNFFLCWSHLYKRFHHVIQIYRKNFVVVVQTFRKRR